VWTSCPQACITPSTLLLCSHSTSSYTHIRQDEAISAKPPDILIPYRTRYHPISDEEMQHSAIYGH
jgi:hypothetical protein